MHKVYIPSLFGYHQVTKNISTTLVQHLSLFTETKKNHQKLTRKKGTKPHSSSQHNA